MDHFLYQNGILHAEDVPLPEIAAAVGSPVYVYSTATFSRHLRVFQEALDWTDHLICYAVKANSNVAILKLLGDLGAGMDIVSLGEYLRARAAGVSPDRIVFSGVGKTKAEMERVLAEGIRQFNLESVPEMELLSQIATSMGVTVPVTVRVNPDVDAKTHAKIATGKAENKFGIPISDAPAIYDRIRELPGLEAVGIDCHIGSQLTDLDPFREAYLKVRTLTQTLRDQGHTIARLDLGGGLGIPYKRSNSAPPLPIDYGKVIRETVGDLGCEIEIEPGRNIAGNAGILLTEVIFRKSGADREFLILDAAMNDLVRPAMYEAHHDIVPVVEPEPGAEPGPVDLVGPVCETGDTFAKQRLMPHASAGDLIAFRSAGAYGAVMASEYNTRPLVPEVLVNGDQFAVIRERPSFDEIINRDKLPSWMQD